MYFETIKCNDEEVFHLNYHKERIARTIGLNIQLEEYIYPPSKQLLKCKIIYDKNGILDIAYTPYQKKIIKNLKLVYDDNINYKYKSTNRDMLNKLYDQKGDCDDIIIVKNGLITDTTIANIAVYIDDIWYTPKTPLLQGTTRDRLLDKAILKEKDITPQYYAKATKIALMNAMIGFCII
jgi:4-amino-4-deoxychorismate lyase